MTNENKEIKHLEEHCQECIKACEAFKATKDERFAKDIIDSIKEISHEEYIVERLEQIKKQLMEQFREKIEKAIMKDNDFSNEQKTVIEKIRWIKDMDIKLQERYSNKQKIIANIETKTTELLNLLTREAKTNQAMDILVTQIDKIAKSIKKIED